MRFSLLGVSLDSLSRRQVSATLSEWLSSGAPQFHQIVTTNPEFLMEAQRNEGYKKILNAADLSLPDGAGIVYCARLFYGATLTRITGVELTNMILEQSSLNHTNVAIIGVRSQDVADSAAKLIAKRFPGVSVVYARGGKSPEGSTKPVFAEKESVQANDALLEELKTARPDVLFVAHGSPFQDEWISRCAQDIPSLRLAVGVGGTFDYMTGVVSYAPYWMRVVGLEWLFRLIMQPHRWKRIVTATLLFPYAVFQEKFFKKA